MSFVINTNISADQATRSLNQNSLTLSKTFQRLASGIRVNSAADDAAGLSISTRMTAQVRGINKAVGNANDAISLAQTSDGAMNELTGLLQRMRELTVQALSETNTLDERLNIQAEVDQLVEEVNRIGEVKFNGKKVFGGDFNFQLGDGNQSASQLTLKTSKLENRLLGSHSNHLSQGVGVGSALADGDITIVKNDGTRYSVRASHASDDQLSTVNQDGSAIAKAAAINATTDLHGVTAQVGETTLLGVGFNVDQVLDQDNVLTINGQDISGFTAVAYDADGALRSAINAVSEETGVVASRDDTGNLKLVAEDGRNIDVRVTGDAANLGFGAGTTQGASLRLISKETYTIEFASDAVNTSAMGNIGTTTPAGAPNPLGGIDNIVFGHFDQNQSFAAAADVGTMDEVSGFFTENGASDYTGFTFEIRFFGNTANLYGEDPADPNDWDFITSSPITDNGAQKEMTFTLNGTNVNITFTPGNNYDDVHNGEGGDVSAVRFTLDDGELGGGVAADLDSVMGKDFTDSSVASLATGEINNLLTTASAERALGIIDFAIDEANATRAELGALTNRLSSTISNLNQSKNNIMASRSQIMDADIAAETATLSRSQIIQQAGVSMLAQANASQQTVLSLL